jgi:NADH:ubiquinone oxidoreductase subunit 6 (subunit J)
MDSLHAIGFYVSAALAGVGGVLLAFLRGHWNRGVALAVTGLGLAGIYASLSAGFAAVVVLVCYAVCALLVARPDYRSIEQAVGGAWRQVGAVGAAGLFAVLAYAAFRGQFAHLDAGWTGYAPLTETFNVGSFGSVAVARLLFGHDALATEAIGGVVLVALVGAAVAWRRERPRDEREGRR